MQSNSKFQTQNYHNLKKKTFNFFFSQPRKRQHQHQEPARLDEGKEPERESPLHGTERQGAVRVGHNCQVPGRVPWQRPEAVNQ